jgi:hypothetical protein
VSFRDGGCGFVFAQATPIINGQTNPTAIPDSIAYQSVLLYFQQPSATEAEAQRIGRISGLNTSDAAILTNVAQEAAAAYDACVSSNNSGTGTGCALGVSFRTTLQSQLSADGFLFVDAFIQNEKNTMQVYPNN